MIESLLVTTLTILITWLLVIFCLAGTGQLLIRIFGLHHFNLTVLIISFWIGFATFLMFGQIWNIFLPADWRMWPIYICLAIVGFVINHKQISHWLRAILSEWKITTIFIFVTLAFAIEIAFRASHGIPVHDTGSYHLPATLWFHSFPLVPGLSNLHSRLGFNSSLFVYAASLSEWVWAQRPHHIMMGPLILMTYMVSFLGFRRIIFSTKAVDFSDIFGASLILPVYFIYHWMQYANSLSPNAVVFILLLIILWMIEKGILRQPDKRVNIFFVGAAIVSVLTITIKLTIAPFASFLWLFVIYRIVKDNRAQNDTPVIKPVVCLIIFSFLLILPWLTRSIILSGYPVYPFTIGGIDVDWKVPEIQAQLDAAWTYSYSRGAYIQPVVGYAWVWNWVKNIFNINRLLSGASLPIIISLIAALALMVVGAFKGWKKFLFIGRGTGVILVAILGGIIIWFFTAPDIRFGIGYFWMLACLLLSLLFYWFWKYVHRRMKHIIIVILAIICISAIVIKAKRVFERLHSSEYPIWSFEPNQKWDDLLNEGLSDLPEAKMRKFVTESGLTVNVPLEGNQIWDAPLLSTPHPSPGLSLRNSHNIAEGFKSVGEWRPYGYPILIYPWHNYVTRRLDQYYGEQGKEDKE